MISNSAYKIAIQNANDYITATDQLKPYAKSKCKTMLDLTALNEIRSVFYNFAWAVGSLKQLSRVTPFPKDILDLEKTCQSLDLTPQKIQTLIDNQPNVLKAVALLSAKYAEK